MSATASPFTPEQQKVFDAEVAKIFPKYPADQRAAALIPVLHVAQQLHGWLKPETLTYVAGVVGVPETRVQEVVSFYGMFNRAPLGERHFSICVNLACWLAGSDDLVNRLKERLGEAQRQPTEDGRFSWCEVECLASCGTAPVAVVNGEYRESFSLQQLDAELADKGAKK